MSADRSARMSADRLKSERSSSAGIRMVNLRQSARHPSVLLIGHRGASTAAPENTRASILEAFRAGAHMVELDVQMTRDGRLVIMHDERLERTTNGAGRVSAMRYAQLTRLDAGSWFHPRFAGERILLASEALRVIPPHRWINLELKASTRPRPFIARVMSLLRRRGTPRRVLISSFDAALLRPLCATRSWRALICSRRPHASLVQAIRLGCRAWHPLHTLLTRPLIARAHAAGLRVHAWTVDDPVRARQLMRAGVDGLFTNDPARLRSVMCRGAARRTPHLDGGGTSCPR